MIALFTGILITVVAVDLLTKFACDGILNTGIAWGLGAELPWLWIAVVFLSFVLTVGMLVWYLRTPRRQSVWFTVGMALFLGGVLANAIDRTITGGAVHDFINFIIFQNNLADIGICVGALMIGGHVAFR